jgi:hypothetical protein
MQQFIVWIVVLIAAIVLIRRLYIAFRSGGQQGCGCSSCSQCTAQSTCTLIQDPEKCPEQEENDKEKS